jgi:hypothetical protein
MKVSATTAKAKVTTATMPSVAFTPKLDSARTAKPKHITVIVNTIALPIEANA